MYENLLDIRTLYFRFKLKMASWNPFKHVMSHINTSPLKNREILSIVLLAMCHLILKESKYY